MSPIEPRYSVAYHWFTYEKRPTKRALMQPLEFNSCSGRWISFHRPADDAADVAGVLISWSQFGSGSRVLRVPAAARSGMVGVFSSFDLVLFYVFFSNSRWCPCSS